MSWEDPREKRPSPGPSGAMLLFGVWVPCWTIPLMGPITVKSHIPPAIPSRVDAGMELRPGVEERSLGREPWGSQCPGGEFPAQEGSSETGPAAEELSCGGAAALEAHMLTCSQATKVLVGLGRRGNPIGLGAGRQLSSAPRPLGPTFGWMIHENNRYLRYIFAPGLLSPASSFCRVA